MSLKETKGAKGNLRKPKGSLGKPKGSLRVQEEKKRRVSFSPLDLTPLGFICLRRSNECFDQSCQTWLELLKSP